MCHPSYVHSASRFLSKGNDPRARGVVQRDLGCSYTKQSSVRASCRTPGEALLKKAQHESSSEAEAHVRRACEKLNRNDSHCPSVADAERHSGPRYFPSTVTPI